MGERAPVLAEVRAERRPRPRRLQPDDAAHRRGEADRAAHVVAVRDRRRGRPRPRPRSRRSIRRCCDSRSHGLRVAPYASGSVVQLVASSGVLVLPTNTKPAARKRRREPGVVGLGPARSRFSSRMPQWYGSPAVWHTASLTRNGTPRNGPAAACVGLVVRAFSNRSWITALSSGLRGPTRRSPRRPARSGTPRRTPQLGLGGCVRERELGHRAAGMCASIQANTSARTSSRLVSLNSSWRAPS